MKRTCSETSGFADSRSRKYLPPASPARAAPLMHYHTCCNVAQSTRSLAEGKYFLERLYPRIHFYWIADSLNHCNMFATARLS
ncbi:hypothetical protein Y032_0018g3547 [Ancylostoma ceylanicum]|uniref:Uncharacterized protein n=1 Tax=Ancylostoma ceylanicum TaxID=53326 RepID=A0A016V2W5_9BILA|nr:hypothetical protein Y032_0018g3547 [Ancylostoma ceylanicum]